jgi:hypothetical protein
LELASGGTGALLFFQCNLTWKNFPQARDSGYGSFDSFCCFILAKWGSRISARFLIYRAHTLCFCTLVTILAPLFVFSSLNFFLLQNGLFLEKNLNRERNIPSSSNMKECSKKNVVFCLLSQDRTTASENKNYKKLVYLSRMTNNKSA